MEGLVALAVVAMIIATLVALGRSSSGPRSIRRAAPEAVDPVDLAGGDPYIVLDKPLACVVCRNQGFHTREAKLNTTGMTMLGLDWANQSADCLVCTRCGYVHWFVP